MDRDAALSKVNGPATALMVVAGIGGACQVLAGFMNTLSMVAGGAVALNEQAEGIELFTNGVMGLMVNFAATLFAILVIVAAVKMKKLNNHALAMAGAIVIMVPCLSPCCLFGIPVGIWALMTLNDPDVRAAFDR